MLGWDSGKPQLQNDSLRVIMTEHSGGGDHERRYVVGKWGYRVRFILNYRQEGSIEIVIAVDDQE